MLRCLLQPYDSLNFTSSSTKCHLNPLLNQYKPSSSLKSRFSTTRRPSLRSVKHASYSTLSQKKPNASKIRNLGIIAHVDAGKTTTSERMLYYSGESQLLGDVDKGDTVLDYLKIERERGITINAAAITFNWKDHSINLIDTPGHVDFTAEVERSVRVLDGAVAIFDAVAGVQAQTETVWAQANRYQVPRIAFINKMDREGAAINTTLESMKRRLRANPLLIQLPLGSSKSFYGVVDLIEMEEITWDQDSLGIKYFRNPVEPESKTEQLTKEARQKLVEQVAELDDQLMEYVFSDANGMDVPADVLRDAIRRVTLSVKGVPVLMGSSLRNLGVQPVMDAVIDFFPSPLERSLPEAYLSSHIFDEEETTQVAENASDNMDKPIQLTCDPKQPLVAQAFKVVHEPRTNGLVVYCRVYSGTLQTGQKLINTTKAKEERSLRITRVYADRFLDLKELSAGDIGAVTGLKHTSTGDTIVGLKDPKVKVKGMNIPEPVFWMSILADSTNEEEHLRNSLNLLQLEDPSFKWMVNKDTAQWLMCGMGELHLEIIKDRLFNHYKVKATTGDIQIAYKSTIKSEVSEPFSRTYNIGSRTEEVILTLEMNPKEPGTGTTFEIDEGVFLSLAAMKKVKSDLSQAFNEAATDAIRSGIPAGFPLLDAEITLSDLKYNPSTSMHTYKLALMEAIFNCARAAGVQILEPIMKVEIVLSDEYVGGVLSDLTSKRGGVIETVDHGGEGKKLIHCKVPLKDIMGYSTELRSLSKGTASMISEFSHNGPLSPQQQTKLLGTTYFD